MRRGFVGFLSAVALVALFSTSAKAASYTFDVNYFGGGIASLAAGSDDPLTTNLAAGDDFTYILTADPDDYWEVFNAGGLFPLFSLATQDSGTRNADFTLTLSLNGAPQLVFSQNNINNSFAHIGTNIVNLAAGLQFDRMHLTYDLLSSNNVNNRPNSRLPFPGMGPEQFFANNIRYVQQEVVPEPATLMLLGAGLTAFAARARRRSRG